MVLSNPLVSVCVQTYNHKKYISECLDGILMQRTSFPFEIVLGEDESSDGTREICIKYSEEYPDKFRLFLRSRKDVIHINGNPTGRYNMIENLKAAKGKYIALCEGDDYWTDSLKLQKQYDILEQEKNISLVFTNGLVKYENNDFKDHLIYRDEPYQEGQYPVFKIPKKYTTLADLVKGNFIHTPGVMFKNWIADYGIPKYMYEATIGDWPLHLKTATMGDIYYLDDNTYSYRVHQSGVYSAKSRIEKIKMSLGQVMPLLRSSEFNSDEFRNLLKSYILMTFNRYVRENNMVLDQYAIDLQDSLVEYYPNFISERKITMKDNQANKNNFSASSHWFGNQFVSMINKLIKGNNSRNEI